MGGCDGGHVRASILQRGPFPQCELGGNTPGLNMHGLGVVWNENGNAYRCKST